MNSAVVVSSRSWVRCAGRQSQRLQVTPASSHHTTSPVSGCSTTAMSSATASKDRSPLKPDQARRPYLAVQVLSAERQQVVADRAAGRAGVTLVERPNPQAAINDVVVEVHASGFVPDEMEWPSTRPIAPAMTEHRRFSGTTWLEWSPPAAMARPEFR